MSVVNYPKLAKELTRYTGDGALAEVYAPDKDQVIVAVLVHLPSIGGASAGDVVVQLDDVEGAPFDTVLYTKTMDAAADAVYLPTRPLPLPKGSKLNISFDNTNALVYGVTVWAQDYRG
ncbi:MAG: hypothetical protein KJ576_20915 [Proteobacteria bacterium]|nr:hypothetical protein [Pseudomonadota bacterium]